MKTNFDAKDVGDAKKTPKSLGIKKSFKINAKTVSILIVRIKKTIDATGEGKHTQKMENFLVFFSEANARLMTKEFLKELLIAFSYFSRPGTDTPR